MKTTLIIEWDREAGEFQIFIKGPPLHQVSANALLQEVIKTINESIDEDGYITEEEQEEKKECQKEKILN